MGNTIIARRLASCTVLYIFSRQTPPDQTFGYMGMHAEKWIIVLAELYKIRLSLQFFSCLVTEWNAVLKKYEYFEFLNNFDTNLFYIMSKLFHNN